MQHALSWNPLFSSTSQGLRLTEWCARLTERSSVAPSVEPRLLNRCFPNFFRMPLVDNSVDRRFLGRSISNLSFFSFLSQGLRSFPQSTEVVLPKNPRLHLFHWFDRSFGRLNWKDRSNRDLIHFGEVICGLFSNQKLHACYPNFKIHFLTPFLRQMQLGNHTFSHTSKIYKNQAMQKVKKPHISWKSTLTSHITQIQLRNLLNKICAIT